MRSKKLCFDEKLLLLKFQENQNRFRVPQSNSRYLWTMESAIESKKTKGNHFSTGPTTSSRHNNNTFFEYPNLHLIYILTFSNLIVSIPDRIL